MAEGTNGHPAEEWMIMKQIANKDSSNSEGEKTGSNVTGLQKTGRPMGPMTAEHGQWDVYIDTFNEKQWKYKDAADHLAISKGTLKRLTMMELAEGAPGIGTLRIGPKKAQTLYTYADSALRRIHNRMTGGYYGRPGRP